MKVDQMARRTFLGALALGALGGCAWRNRGRPVVLGGHRVSREEPIMAALAASSDHSMLSAALRGAGLDEVLSGPGPLSIFAPTDAAFTAADLSTLDVEEVLRGHIVRARVTGEELAIAISRIGEQTRLLPLSSHPIAVEGDLDELRVVDMREGAARIVTRDAEASNGFIHSIDAILLPPLPKPPEG